ncbi:MAG: CbiX/SirB N-terminal domain-containing protein [Gemmatimonadota bacterium]|nr:MAG: CbiX/SirB N-terminal domain-containing protein [Gemmatimonadota bacterium]
MLIIVAHGSLDPNWRASVERMADSIEADVGPDRVRLAYMDHTPPTLDDVVSEAVDRGVARVRVLPLFLADEGHVDRDIRPIVERLRAIHRSVEVELLPALGQHRGFREFLANVAREESGSNA